MGIYHNIQNNAEFIDAIRICINMGLADGRDFDHDDDGNEYDFEINGQQNESGFMSLRRIDNIIRAA